MELQATSFDASEELLNIYHLRALLHSVIANAGGGLPEELIERL